MSDDRHTEEAVHTYKDDIMYQIVKENCRRTSFVSSDHQIVSTGANVIRNIEKSEKLLTDDLRRNQAALLNKLESLQKKREDLNIGERPIADTGFIQQRRNSAPFVNSYRSKSPIKKLQREHSIMFNYNKTGSVRTGRCDDTGALENRKSESNLPSPRRDRSVHYVRSGSNSPGSVSVSPDLREARRLSFVAQEETSRKALEKVKDLVSDHKRRATIAVGATHQFGLLPSASDIARLTEIAQRSISIEEEGGSPFDCAADDSPR